MNISYYQIVVFILSVLEFVKTWDVALTSGNEIIFYENGTKVNRHRGEEFFDLVGVTYDAFNKRIFLVDYNKNSAASSSIYSLSIKNRKVSLITSQRGFIHDLAYDPNTDKVFWTNIKTKGIYFKPLPANNRVRMVFMDFEENETPVAIAVDSCRGYVYWTQWATRFTIQRARLDGMNRETIIDDDLHFPNALVIDQRFKKLYWVDTTEDDHYYISSSDLHGKQRQVLLSGYKNIPIDMSVSFHSLFWVDESAKHIWKVRKEKDQIPFIYREIQKGNAIYAHYTLDEQTRGVPECKALRQLYKKMTTEFETDKKVQWKNVENQPNINDKTPSSNDGLDELEDDSDSGRSNDGGIDWTKFGDNFKTLQNDNNDDKLLDSHFHFHSHTSEPNNDDIEWKKEGKVDELLKNNEKAKFFSNDVESLTFDSEKTNDFIEFNQDDHYKKSSGKHFDADYHYSKEDKNEWGNLKDLQKAKDEIDWNNIQFFNKPNKLDDGHYHKSKNFWTDASNDDIKWSKISETKINDGRGLGKNLRMQPNKAHQHSRQTDENSDSHNSEGVKKSEANRLKFCKVLFISMFIVTSNTFMQ